MNLNGYEIENGFGWRQSVNLFTTALSQTNLWKWERGFTQMYDIYSSHNCSGDKRSCET